MDQDQNTMPTDDTQNDQSTTNQPNDVLADDSQAKPEDQNVQENKANVVQDQPMTDEPVVAHDNAETMPASEEKKEEMPAEKPVEESVPAETEETETMPAEEKPTQEMPTPGQPAESQTPTATEEPTNTQPVTEEVKEPEIPADPGNIGQSDENRNPDQTTDTPDNM